MYVKASFSSLAVDKWWAVDECRAVDEW